jgi:hypothetical protein
VATGGRGCKGGRAAASPRAKAARAGEGGGTAQNRLPRGERGLRQAPQLASRSSRRQWAVAAAREGVAGWPARCACVSL